MQRKNNFKVLLLGNSLDVYHFTIHSGAVFDKHVSYDFHKFDHILDINGDTFKLCAVFGLTVLDWVPKVTMPYFGKENDPVHAIIYVNPEKINDPLLQFGSWDENYMDKWEYHRKSQTDYWGNAAPPCCIAMIVDPSKNTPLECLRLIPSEYKSEYTDKKSKALLFQCGNQDPASILSEIPVELVSTISCTFFRIAVNIRSPITTIPKITRQEPKKDNSCSLQ